MTRKSDKKKEERFEAALARLEGLVRKLEEGDLDLEESLSLFEQGVALSRQLNERLTQAEERVEILLRQPDGRLEPKPMPGAADDEPDGEGGDDA